MSKKKVQKRNIPVSVSITHKQKRFLDNNPYFSLSKFVQLHLDEHINLSDDINKAGGLKFNDE